MPTPTQTEGGQEGLRRPGDLRRLRIVGVVGPLLFVLALELVRLFLIEGSFSDYGPNIVLALSTLVAIVAFSFVMFHFIGRAQGETAEVVADLRRRQREGHAFYDALLRISNQEPLPDILAAVARHARDLLGGDAAALCLNDATTRSVQLDPALAGAASLREGICISPGAGESYSLEDPERMRRLSSSSEFGEELRLEVQTPDRKLGELWVGRRHPVPFSERDRQFLATFADFASIAVTGARMRESERQAAILAERERIARELHDSLAQVLGAVHLRLRSLAARGEAELPAATALELNELADVCEEGYRDARGAILDLHESSRSDRNLLEGLRAYLDKYSRQCGIAASLDTDLEHDLALPPSSEIQIIRVIQEALANVRKHSGAVSATVRIARADGRATFLIEDNGRGFDATEALLDRDGFGLHAMRQRMELIGGDLLTDSAPGRGTRVVATVPEVPARAPIPSL